MDTHAKPAFNATPRVKGKDLWQLAYEGSPRKRHEWFFPGTYYDACVIGLFLVLGIAYLL